MFTNIEVQKINDEIKKEFLKLFTENELNEINKLLNEQQKDLNEKGEDAKKKLSAIYGTSLCFGLGFALCSALFFPFVAGGILVLGVIETIFLGMRNKQVKNEIDSNINIYYEKCKETFILINIYLIKRKAEIYNNIVDEFNKYINEYENENLF